MESFGRRLSQGFDQVKQYASEKMGVAEDITEFPLAYRQLDEKMEQMKVVFEGLNRAVKQLHDSDKYDAPLADSLKSGFERLQEKIRNSEESNKPANSEGDKNIHQALGEVCISGAELLADELNTVQSGKSSANLLRRLGQVEMKIGQARQSMSEALDLNFLIPFAKYEEAFEKADLHRKNALRVRLLLDACKNKLRGAEGEKLVQITGELSVLETEFVTACDDAIHEMRNFMQLASTIHCLESLISIQLSYHKKCVEELLTLNSNF